MRAKDILSRQRAPRFAISRLLAATLLAELDRDGIAPRYESTCLGRLLCHDPATGPCESAKWRAVEIGAHENERYPVAGGSCVANIKAEKVWNGHTVAGSSHRSKFSIGASMPNRYSIGS